MTRTFNGGNDDNDDDDDDDDDDDGDDDVEEKMMMSNLSGRPDVFRVNQAKAEPWTKSSSTTIYGHGNWSYMVMAIGHGGI